MKNRIFVTGAAGFVGSHLVNYLSQHGARVIGISRIESKEPGVTRLDAANYREIEKVFRRNPPFTCFHLAGEALVEHGQEAPYETLRNNIISTLNILELCRRYRVRRIIIASTVHVYGDAPVPYKEEDPPRPSRPYETSKTCTDLIAQSYADSFHLPVLIPRFVNIYGPGDLHFTRVIPKTIKSVLLGEQPTLWGGDAIREYLYIDDAVRAYDLLAKMSDSQIERNRIYNFGALQPVSVAELIDMIIALSGKKVTVKKAESQRIGEIPVQRVSWTKARHVLGWEPSMGLREGLCRTIDWYRRFFRKVP